MTAREKIVTDFGFAVFAIDFSGSLNNFATLPSGRRRGVYLINGEKVCESDWLIAYRNAEEIALGMGRSWSNRAIGAREVK